MAQFSIQADVAQAATVAFNSGLLTGLCTIQTLNTSQGASGAPDNTWTNYTGLVAIPCQISVPSANAVQATEVRALEELMAKSVRHVLLGGYYPILKQLAQAGQVRAQLTMANDSTVYTYQVMGAEDDSQGVMTRFECEWISL
jgi:hypothetical protein